MLMVSAGKQREQVEKESDRPCSRILLLGIGLIANGWFHPV